MNFIDELKTSGKAFWLLIDSCIEQDGKATNTCGIYFVYCHLPCIDNSCIKIFNYEKFENLENYFINADLKGYEMKEDVTHFFNDKDIKLNECIRPMSKNRRVNKAYVIQLADL